MKNYKRKVITWLILTIIAFIAIITLSILINSLSSTLELTEKVTLDQKIVDTYQFTKAYSIGGLALSCLIFVIGSVISYAGLKSWKYAEMFS
ncbi:hypothetical protein [Mycoplasma nasistruthionis]|uniref:Uncharacterized protein n=1 Tax=Mycoplasma nasistruthionis TaxID=353852 RepID=A0A4Y6I642_9MOLU|nr:hypothetical protein [Mycoplasma nasistruthionis]QCZ36483.1 hypothetical protein FG904_00370 [Mycoplasma nasistruthionis]QDF64777.1 hypothetical protein FIV53_00360 [Mycoplasma nasistruthionis]